jgi:hypothetical protein
MKRLSKAKKSKSKKTTTECTIEWNTECPSCQRAGFIMQIDMKWKEKKDEQPLVCSCGNIWIESERVALCTKCQTGLHICLLDGHGSIAYYCDACQFLDRTGDCINWEEC